MDRPQPCLASNTKRQATHVMKSYRSIRNRVAERDFETSLCSTPGGRGFPTTKRRLRLAEMALHGSQSLGEFDPDLHEVVFLMSEAVPSAVCTSCRGVRRSRCAQS